jgi:acetolactate synthase-1/2/3 large subunit
MEIRYEMEKAFFIAREGRPGPVIIDIPDDFQRVEIDPNHLRAFKPENSEMIYDYDNLEIEIDSLIATIEKAEKPILILGAGFHISKSSKFARELSSKLGIPTLLTWGAKDLLPFADEINLGGLGVCGSRLGNWAIQASDLVIVVGSRLSQMITGSKLGSFAPLATKVMIDIEKEEFKKFKKTELKIDHFINVDIKILEVAFRNRSKPKLTDSAIEWKTRLFSLRQEYNVVKENMNSTSNINVYKFMKILSDEIEHEDIVITDAGGNLSWTMQAFENKQNQRLFSAWNHSPMGYSMPAAIGASLARSNTRIISIIGDGGIMMCLEEIATIVRNSLNIKIIIINNLGHGIQKQTIETWLENKYVGVDEKTGLNFPNFEVLSKAFGIKYAKISSNESIHNILRGNDFGSNLPQIIEVMIDPQERITPMLKFGSGIENLSPEVPIPVL